MTSKSAIMARYLSDHSPILWQTKQKGVKFKRWRINEDLFKQEIVDQVKIVIKSYFELNSTTEMKSWTLWDAFKAVIRESLMNWNTIEKKRNEKLESLQKELGKKEVELKRRPGKKKLEKQIRLLQEQIRSFDSQELLWTLKRLQQRSFKGANKLGKYLAYQLRKEKRKEL